MFSNSSPLLEEECHPSGEALFANFPDPLRLHAAGVWTALASHDGPVDAHQRDLAKWPEQRLKTQKPDFRWYLHKVLNSPEIVSVFHAHSYPGVWGRLDLLHDIHEACGSFCQHLELMTRGSPDGIKDPSYVGVGNPFVEQVRHAVHEHLSSPLPSVWELEGFRDQAQVKSLLERMPGDSPKPL